MCCCHNVQSGHSSSQCCCNSGFQRSFLTKEEEKEMLENYLEQLRKEQEGVQERLNEL